MGDSQHLASFNWQTHNIQTSMRSHCLLRSQKQPSLILLKPSFALLEQQAKVYKSHCLPSPTSSYLLKHLYLTTQFCFAFLLFIDWYSRKFSLTRARVWRFRRFKSPINKTCKSYQRQLTMIVSGSLGPVRFWCQFVSTKTPNNVVMPQS